MNRLASIYRGAAVAMSLPMSATPEEKFAEVSDVEFLMTQHPKTFAARFPDSDYYRLRMQAYLSNPASQSDNEFGAIADRMTSFYGQDIVNDLVDNAGQGEEASSSKALVIAGGVVALLAAAAAYFKPWSR